MKKASGIDSVSPRVGRVASEIYVSDNITLTDEEASVINGFNRKINEMLITNAYKNHPDTVSEVAEQRKNLLACFPDGMPVYAETITNEYYNDDVHPWYQVTTSVGHVKIGWRKRVISIDWLMSKQVKTAEQLFPNEKVTKEDYLIHAYGYEKAKEYLAKILHKD